MVRLTGLYRRESRNGRTYYTGRLGDARVLAFVEPNPAEGQPDLVVFMAPRAADGARPGGQGGVR